MKWRRKLSILTLVTCMAMTIALMVFSGGCGTEKTQTKAASDGITASKGDVEGGLISGSIIFNAHVRRLQKGVRPTPPIPSVSQKEAEKQVGIKLKLPKETLGGKLIGIYTDKTADGLPGIAVHYSSGFAYGPVVMKDKPDYKARIAAYAEDRKNPAMEIIGADYHIVNVAGFEGQSQPPYEFVSLGDGKTYKLPPSLDWWENGIEYRITPWKLGFTEADLMKVAESMYK